MGIGFRIKFFLGIHKKKILALLIIVPIIAGTAFFVVPPAVATVQSNVTTNRFLNMPDESFLYDFDYLVTAMEENWPFFNLSISANGVDVHELADNMRAILQDPDIDIGGPHGFADLLREHFIWPIDGLGHFRAIWQYQEYFDSLQFTINELQWGVHNFDNVFDGVGLWLEQMVRDETVMFYTTLRDAGGSSLATELPPSGYISVLEAEILEEGRIALLEVNRMIHFWWDPWGGAEMARYQARMHNFYHNIADYEHLIIDMRGNPGGMHLHFDIYVVSPLIDNIITMPGYVFYLDGYHSNLGRETFDMQRLGMNDNNRLYVRPDIELPFLDSDINFGHAVANNYSIWPARLWGQYVESIREPIEFDGKVWILVDGRTASAAEAAAAILKYNDVATLVGENTRGLFGTTYHPNGAIISLPNTGIMLRIDTAYYTDAFGRPFQGYGITPNIFNHPGMDAMETVLALIAAENY